MNYCPKCNKYIEDDALNFCTDCGTPLIRLKNAWTVSLPDSQQKSDKYGKSENSENTTHNKGQEKKPTPKSAPTAKRKPMTTSAPASTLTPRPIPVPKSNRMLFIGSIVVLFIAIGVFFLFSGEGTNTAKVDAPNVVTEKAQAPGKSQTVSVSFDVPSGTKVVFDGKYISNYRDLKVSAGSHTVQLTHPLLEFSYDKKLETSYSGKIVLVKEVKIGPGMKNAAEKINHALMDFILWQACMSDKIKLDSQLFSAKADTNTKISQVHKAMRNYALTNSLKSLLPVRLVSLGKLDLYELEDGKKIVVKCPVYFTGPGAKGTKVEYSIYTTAEIKGDKLIVDSLDNFKAQPNSIKASVHNNK